MLVFPASFPTLFNTLKVNVACRGWGVIMGNFSCPGRPGLSHRLRPQVFNMNLVMASVVILAAAAVVMYRLVLEPRSCCSIIGGQSMKKICIVLCLCLAALLVLPGCAGEKQLTRVRLSEVTHSVFYAPQYVAMSQGFFRQEGLEVELTNGGGADKVMTAVVSGQADMGLAGPEAAIYVMNQGKEDHPVIFAQLTKRDGSFLVAGSRAFSWEDVRGRTIIEAGPAACRR